MEAYEYICDTSNTFLHKSFTLFLRHYSVVDIQTDFQNLQVCFCVWKKEPAAVIKCDMTLESLESILLQSPKAYRFAKLH